MQKQKKKKKAMEKINVSRLFFTLSGCENCSHCALSRDMDAANILVKSKAVSLILILSHPLVRLIIIFKINTHYLKKKRLSKKRKEYMGNFSNLHRR